MGPGRPPISAASVRRLLALLAPFALGLAVAIGSGASRELTPERIQAEILALGALGPLAFLLAATVRPLTVVISGSIFALAAGLVWGPWLGALLALAGFAASAAFVFALARGLGSAAVRDVAGERYAALSERARRRGFAFVFVATLGYLFPTDLVVAVAAVVGTRARTVLLAAVLGNAPGALALAAVGATAVRPAPAVVAAGVAAALLLSVAAGLLARALFPNLPAGRLPSR